MADPFNHHGAGLSDPAYDTYAITLDDATELDPIPRAVYVGTPGATGTLVFRAKNDTEDRTLVGIQAGQILPIRMKLAKASGSTVSDLVALY